MIAHLDVATTVAELSGWHAEMRALASVRVDLLGSTIQRSARTQTPSKPQCALADSALRLHELESLSELPDGIRLIAGAYDRIHRDVGEEYPATVSVEEMIHYIVDHGQTSLLFSQPAAAAYDMLVW